MHTDDTQLRSSAPAGGNAPAKRQNMNKPSDQALKLAAAAFAGAAAGAGAMWAGESVAATPELATPADEAEATAQPTIEQPAEAPVTAADVAAPDLEPTPAPQPAPAAKSEAAHHDAPATPHNDDQPQPKPAVHTTNSFAANHDISIGEAREVTTESGHTMRLAPGTLDGHQAVFRIGDDGQVQAVAVDVNDNGSIDDNEIFDLSEHHLMLSDLTHNNVSQPVNHDTDTVEVISLQHDVDLNGTPVDVAELNVGGDRVVLVDRDQNGEADVWLADTNHNGQLDDDEIRDISDRHIPMPQDDDVQHPADGSMHTAQADTDLPDYSNDADITMYDA